VGSSAIHFILNIIRMAEATFTFQFSGGSSFVFKDTLGLPDKQNKLLTIVFPNKNVLTFTDTVETQLLSSDAQTAGFLGYGTSQILSTFNEWKFNDVLTVNTEELRKDLSYYPQFFKDSAGNNAEFGYEYFPSGVYIVTYSYVYDPTGTGGGGSGGITAGISGGMDYYSRQLIKMDQAANICLKRKIEWLFDNKLDSDTSQKDFNLVKDQVMQLIMMLHVADFDFNNNPPVYEEANLKLMSCDNICASGSLGYLYDSTRP
jgi:hypothetical protein